MQFERKTRYDDYNDDYNGRKHLLDGNGTRGVTGSDAARRRETLQTQVRTVSRLRPWPGRQKRLHASHDEKRRYTLRVSRLRVPTPAPLDS